jgi:hypothetical protein
MNGMTKESKKPGERLVGHVATADLFRRRRARASAVSDTSHRVLPAASVRSAGSVHGCATRGAGPTNSISHETSQFTAAVRGHYRACWRAQLVGALRVHPHKHYADHPLQRDRGFARGRGCFFIRSKRTLRAPLPPKELEQLRGRSTGPNRGTALLWSRGVPKSCGPQTHARDELFEADPPLGQVQATTADGQT